MCRTRSPCFFRPPSNRKLRDQENEYIPTSVPVHSSRCCASHCDARCRFASPADTTALRLWAERQTTVERLRGLTAAYEQAWANVPHWANSGPRYIDKTGAPCGIVVRWPLDPDVTAPSGDGWRIVRPSISECKEHFDFQVRVFGADRERCRANMRRKIRAIVARLRDRKRLFDQLGITELNRQIEATTDAII